MEIQKKLDGKTLYITLDGELNTTTAPKLEAEITPELDRINDMVLDLKKLSYLSSAGLRVLLAAQQELADRGAVTLHGLNEDVREILEATGFDEILVVE